jgi:hypothetical protein
MAFAVLPVLRHEHKGAPTSIQHASSCLPSFFLQDSMQKNTPVVGFPHYREAGRPPGELFVGSQPVSLDLENLNLVRSKR